MLRIHMLQNLYDLSDMGAKYEVLDSRAFSEFCGVDSSNQAPDGDTIGRFRALLVEQGLQERLFAQVPALLQARGLILKKGTIVDSTIIAAPPSTKNREKKRDPEACQTKKGNTCVVPLASAKTYVAVFAQIFEMGTQESGIWFAQMVLFRRGTFLFQHLALPLSILPHKNENARHFAGRFRRTEAEQPCGRTA